MAILPILCLSTIFLVLNSILINDEFFCSIAIAMIALCITVKLDINEQKSRKNIHRK